MAKRVSVQWNDLLGNVPVSCEDCEWAAWMYSFHGPRVVCSDVSWPFWQTVQDLMLHGY